MKFTCNRELLDKHLQFIGRIVAVRNNLPVLSNLLLETDKNSLHISGTDLELAMTTQLEAEILQEGTFTVPAKIFQEFVHQNPDETITFDLESFELVGTSSKVTARISGIDADEFPALPKVEKGTVIRLPYLPLVESLKQVIIACAADLSRPVLTGVLMQISDDTATLAATDSFRLVERKVKIVPIQESITVLIPGRAIGELIRLQPGLSEVEDVEMEVTEQQVLFRLGSVELVSRLLTGNFPKYHAIIPKSFVAIADVTTSEFIQALRLSYIFSQSGVANVLLEIDKEGSLSITSYGSQRGTTKHTVYSIVEEGFAPIKVPFNARFLLDACTATGSSHVQLKFGGVSAPLVIATEDPEYLQLVMPIRIDA